MKKSYIAAALALTSCMVVGTAAASQSNSVTATFRPDMTLKVNGTAYTVRDTTGVKVSPPDLQRHHLPAPVLPGSAAGGGGLLGQRQPDRDHPR